MCFRHRHISGRGVLIQAREEGLGDGGRRKFVGAEALRDAAHRGEGEAGADFVSVVLLKQQLFGHHEDVSSGAQEGE